VHPARSGRNHLRWMAASNGIPVSRVDTVLELVGMTAVARRKVRSYSLGMRQRLGLAGVLLGDPHTLILDEPANGLDPEGVRWIRDVLVALARDGRTILVSSHLLAEISLMADDLVVIGKGRLIEQGPVSQFIDRYAQRWVRVRTPNPAVFADILRRAGAIYRPHGSDGIDVQGLAIERIGEIALQTQTVLHELSPQSESLEEAFLQATADVQEYQSGGSLPPPPGPPSGGAPTGGV
jgi:ABC-2 type transport system ATP-binding protein